MNTMIQKINLFILACTMMLSLAMPQGAVFASQQTVETPTTTQTVTLTDTPTPITSSTPTNTPAGRWITVTSPNGGEILNEGDVYHITWDSSPDIDMVWIMLRQNEHQGNWIVTSLPNTGSYDWTIFIA